MTAAARNSEQTHVVADQSQVLDFLADPRTHGLLTPPIRIDTHGAVVFLAGDNVYKAKRAVRFPFMDLSTLASRLLKKARRTIVSSAETQAGRRIGRFVESVFLPKP